MSTLRKHFFRYWHEYIKEAVFSGIGMSTLRKHVSGIGMSTLRKHFFQVLA